MTNYISFKKLYETQAIDEDFYNEEKERLEKLRVINKKVTIYDSKNRKYEIRINQDKIIIKLKSTPSEGYKTILNLMRYY